MVDYVTKNDLGSISTDYQLLVAGTLYEKNEVILDEATAGYTPANGDVLCRKSDDTNKHQKWDPTDAALVILGVIVEIKEDNATPAVVKLSFATNASVHFAALGYTGAPLSAANKLILSDALRAKNINLVD
jgi:hypothetical protein